MEFEISTPRYSFSSSGLKRNIRYPATEQTQYEWRKFVIKDQESKLYAGLPKLCWVFLTSCTCVTLPVHMHKSLRVRAQSISEMHHGVCGMWLLSWQSPHTFLEQMYICTCLPSLLVPTTASKEPELLKWLFAGPYVLVQLPVGVMAEGCSPLPCMGPDGLEAQRQGVSLQKHERCHVWMGFIVIRSQTLMSTHHLSADFVLLLFSPFFFFSLSPVSCLLLVYFNLVLTNRSYPGCTYNLSCTNPRTLLAWHVAWYFKRDSAIKCVSREGAPQGDENTSC